MNIHPLFDHFQYLDNFGHSLRSPAYLIRPDSTEEVLSAIRLAKEEGLTITVRGAGRSYNDANLNGGGIVLDMCNMNHILEWDATSGLVTVEPGVTLCQLWQTVLPAGWWPPVVSGTMTTTLGGCLGANIHGKNAFRMGTIGEHVTTFTAILPTGAEVTCSPDKNADLFHGMVGGLGLLGIFTSITIQMKRVFSGLLSVHAWNVPNLDVHLSQVLEVAPEHNYTVGWLDATAGGKHLGRGQLHTADYLGNGEDSDAMRTLSVEYQTLPDKFFGLIPKSILHGLMKPFMNNGGTRLVNTAKYVAGYQPKTYRQSHAAFHFLLDYVPKWELAYGQLIQYQSFIPKENALDAWTEMLSLSHKNATPSYLGVVKRHRPDKFLFSYSVDGFSLALDFKVTNNNRSKLQRLLQDFDRIVLEAGGRFYFAKNSETTAESTRLFLGEQALSRVQKLKQRCDPGSILESDLYRRILKPQAPSRSI